MNSSRKVLLIDSAPDRKQRIKALADRGYGVFPALKMDEARSRCTRGGYDLIVVNAGQEQERALEFCDEIRKNCPKQLLLMTSNTNSDRDYAIAGDIPSMVQHVEKLLPRESASPADLASAA